MPPKGLAEVLKWQMSKRDLPAWPRFVPDNVAPQLAESVAPGEIVATFVNHATVLVQMPGLTWITDPVFSERVSPVAWAGPRRVRAPGLRIDEIPALDFILLSHNHYDHMDFDSLGQLMDRFDAQILTPLGNTEYLPLDLRSRTRELDWWQSYQVAEGTRISLAPAKHWSGRGLFDRMRALWGSFVVEHADQRVYFAGDSGYGPHFAQIAERYGAFDLSLLPIGAYEPRWFMQEQHMNPQDAVQAHLDLRSKQSLGIHFGTFRLTDEAIDDPVRALGDALTSASLEASSFVAPKNGQTLHLR